MAAISSLPKAFLSYDFGSREKSAFRIARGELDLHGHRIGVRRPLQWSDLEPRPCAGASASEAEREHLFCPWQIQNRKEDAPQHKLPCGISALVSWAPFPCRWPILPSSFPFLTTFLPCCTSWSLCAFGWAAGAGARLQLPYRAFQLPHDLPAHRGRANGPWPAITASLRLELATRTWLPQPRSSDFGRVSPQTFLSLTWWDSLIEAPSFSLDPPAPWSAVTRPPSLDPSRTDDGSEPVAPRRARIAVERRKFFTTLVSPGVSAGFRWMEHRRGRFGGWRVGGWTKCSMGQPGRGRLRKKDSVASVLQGEVESR